MIARARRHRRTTEPTLATDLTAGSPAAGHPARRIGSRAAAAAVTVPLVALLSAPGAAVALAPSSTAGPVRAESSDAITVVNTETVQARLDAAGRLDEARLYEQLTFTGDGTATVVNPTATGGLRNLDGFGGFTVRDGQMHATVDVDGGARLRTVSDYDGELPIGVEITYLLDGEAVTPKAVVGANGELEVRYTVTNLTTRTDEVSYDDGTGAQATASAETVIPMVGQLTTVLPSNFTAVRSGEASIAGDGRGGTKLSFTMTLFPPIGATSASFGYTAQIRDGVVPPANVSALPVSPLESPSFKGGAASLAGGAASGIALTAGATEIDANLLRLRDGAATLLDGLQQLKAGAAELAAGLNGSAAPGAERLADGAAELGAGAATLASGATEIGGGAQRIAAGAQTLNDGAQRLAAGTAQAHDGARRLAAGATEIDGGADRLAAGAGEISAGLDQAGEKAPGIVAGLGQVRAGLDQVDAGLVEMSGSIGALPAQAQPLHDGVASLRAGIANLQVGATSVRTTTGQVGSLLTALAATHPTVDPADPVTAGTLVSLGTFINGVADTKPEGVERETLRAVAAMYLTPTTPLVDLGPGLSVLGGVLTTGVVPGVWRLQCGLGGLDEATRVAVCGGATGLDEGAVGLDAGLTRLVDAVVAGIQGGIGTEGQTSVDGTLRGGVASLEAGTGELIAGAQTLVDGVNRLAVGASTLSTGAATLSGGAGALSTGATTLSEGTAALADGAGVLVAGTGTLRDGATTLGEGGSRLDAGARTFSAGAQRLVTGGRTLADGLGDAAAGSTTLADGLTTAAEAAPALVDGAQQLSDEGTSVLVDTGAATAADYGVKYAVIEAGAERAATEAMAYGGPEGSVAVTAYSLDIAGVDGSGASSFSRGLIAAALFAVGGLAATLWRRRLG